MRLTGARAPSLPLNLNSNSDSAQSASTSTRKHVTADAYVSVGLTPEDRAKGIKNGGGASEGESLERKNLIIITHSVTLWQ